MNAATVRCVRPDQLAGHTRYRGADHTRCHHTTPLPAGWRRCAGDPGCEQLLPARGQRRLCSAHEDVAWTYDDETRALAAAGLNPGRAAP